MVWARNLFLPQGDGIELRFHLEGEKLILRGGGYQCGIFQAEYPYSVFQIKGSFLYWEDTQVGLIGESNLSLVDLEQGYQLHLFLNDDGSMSFNEMWLDGGDFLIIRGKLSLGDQ